MVSKGDVDQMLKAIEDAVHTGDELQIAKARQSLVNLDGGDWIVSNIDSYIRLYKTKLERAMEAKDTGGDDES